MRVILFLGLLAALFSSRASRAIGADTPPSQQVHSTYGTDDRDTSKDAVLDPVQKRLDAEATDAARRADQWRFRYHNNRWWYYTPEKNWMYHDNNSWTRYDAKNYVPPRYTSGYRGDNRSPRNLEGFRSTVATKRLPVEMRPNEPVNRAPADFPDTTFRGTKVHALGEGLGGATSEPVRNPGSPASGAKLP